MYTCIVQVHCALVQCITLTNRSIGESRSPKHQFKMWKPYLRRVTGSEYFDEAASRWLHEFEAMEYSSSKATIRLCPEGVNIRSITKSLICSFYCCYIHFSSCIVSILYLSTVFIDTRYRNIDALALAMLWCRPMTLDYIAARSAFLVDHTLPTMFPLSYTSNISNLARTTHSMTSLLGQKSSDPNARVSGASTELPHFA